MKSGPQTRAVSIQKQAKEPRKPSILHLGFEVALLLKGLHAALEVVGGVLLWLVKPDTLNGWTRLLTQNELAEDPKDLIANLLVQAGQHYTVNAQHFGVFYLLTHGFVKVVLVLLLWRRKLWAYPLAVAVLVLFIAYQIFRWTSTHSALLIFLSVFDALIIWLTLSEYLRLKGEDRATSRA
jgi:uncharacterized membrane protein